MRVSLSACRLRGARGASRPDCHAAHRHPGPAHTAAANRDAGPVDASAADVNTTTDSGPDRQTHRCADRRRHANASSDA